MGIAAGIGFYEGAVAAAALIIVTLLLLKKLEYRVASKYRTIYIICSEKTGITGKITDVFDRYTLKVKNMDYINDEEKDGQMVLKFSVKTSVKFNWQDLRDSLYSIEGTSKIYEA